jgi:hypothetical protein
MVERTIERGRAAWPEQTAAARPEVGRARLLLLAVAVWIGACDLIVKTIAPTETGLYHRRTYYELALILAISATLAYFVPLTRSRLMSLGTGLMVGGGIGNGLSIAIFSLGVPNPIEHGGWTIAFNLADIGVATGFLLATVGVLSLGIDRRHELREPVDR